MKDQRVVVNKVDQSYWAYVKRQFKKNKLALWSLYVACFLAMVALFADFIASDKPLIATYEGTTYFPVLKSYAVDLGLQSWPEQFRNVRWYELEFDFVIWTPIPYTPTYMDYQNSNYVGPFHEQMTRSLQWHHWLGTDDYGRDVMSGMIHGTRIAFLVGIISMSIATLIGVFLGSIAGFFGDDRLRLSRIKVIMLLLFTFLGFFYAFGVRFYVLTDALGDNYGAFLIEIIISLLLLIALVILGYLLAKPLEVFAFLKKSVAIPVDIMVSRLIEVIVSIPTLFLIISIIAIAQPSIFLVMAVIGLVSWTGIARFIRAEILRVRSLEYIEASHALGYSDKRTITRHVIPNALSPVLIAVAFGIATAILTESTLSFLGIGVSADTITWGSMLSDARRAPDAWWIATFPGFAIFMTVTIFNLIGEGLTDALDPRLKQ
jgi:peptide/nickel transport system permease protein